MEKAAISTIIVDDNEEFCSILYDYLSIQKDISVVGIVHNGIDALKLIENTKPDLVILDIIMPNLDGLGVLEALRTMNMGTTPKVIVLSTIGQDKITQRAISLGAEYYVVKPFDMEMLALRIRQLFAQSPYAQEIPSAAVVNIVDDSKFCKKEINLEEQITDVLHQVGIPPHIKGYIYLREAISIVFNDPTLISSVARELYPSIAEKFKTKASRVERAIRHAIEIAWSRGQIESVSNLLGHELNDKKTRPSNSEFIATVADRLRLRNKVS